MSSDNNAVSRCLGAAGINGAAGTRAMALVEVMMLSMARCSEMETDPAEMVGVYSLALALLVDSQDEVARVMRENYPDADIPEPRKVFDRCLALLREARDASSEGSEVGLG